MKPEFFTDRKIGALGPIPALVYQALWVIADDHGTAPCDADRIKGTLFYAWSAVGVPEITGALQELDALGRIVRYRVGDDVYCRIRNWNKHQNVHKASKFRYPTEGESLTPNSAEIPGTGSENSGTPHHLDSKTPRHLDTHKRRGAGAPKSTSRKEDVDQVFDHYQTTHPLSKVGDEEQHKVVRRALKLGFTVDDLKHAITANARDPWHRMRQLHALGYVLGKADQINKFLAKYEEQEAPVEEDLFP